MLIARLRGPAGPPEVVIQMVEKWAEGAEPSRRSTTFERATPKVVLTVFTGYLPEAASATARSVFLPAQDRAPP